MAFQHSTTYLIEDCSNKDQLFTVIASKPMPKLTKNASFLLPVTHPGF